jgi:hypothetical protein
MDDLQALRGALHAGSPVGTPAAATTAIASPQHQPSTPIHEAMLDLDDDQDVDYDDDAYLVYLMPHTQTASQQATSSVAPATGPFTSALLSGDNQWSAFVSSLQEPVPIAACHIDHVASCSSTASDALATPPSPQPPVQPNDRQQTLSQLQLVELQIKQLQLQLQLNQQQQASMATMRSSPHASSSPVQPPALPSRASKPQLLSRSQELVQKPPQQQLVQQQQVVQQQPQQPEQQQQAVQQQVPASPPPQLIAAADIPYVYIGYRHWQ